MTTAPKTGLLGDVKGTTTLRDAVTVRLAQHTGRPPPATAGEDFSSGARPLDHSAISSGLGLLI